MKMGNFNENSNPGANIALVLVGVLFLSLACNSSSLSSSTPSPLVPTQTPEVGFLGGTAVSKDKTKIVILSANVDTESNFNMVIMLLPDSLSGVDVFANDVKLEPQNGDEEKSIQFDLSGKVSAKKVVFVFKQGDNQLATCTLDGADLLNAEGDCGW